MRLVRVKATVNVLLMMDETEPKENAELSVKSIITEGFDGCFEEYDRLVIEDLSSEEVKAP